MAEKAETEAAMEAEAMEACTEAVLGALGGWEEPEELVDSTVGVGGLVEEKEVYWATEE